MRIDDLADRIYRDLGSPSDISAGLVAFWLRNNIGALNDLIGTEYALDNQDYEIVPEVGNNESVMFHKLYQLTYYEKQIRSNLGANGVDIVQEVNEFGASVRMINKNEVAKTFLQLRKDLSKELNDLITAYNIGSATPQAVHGDDLLTVNGVALDETNRVRNRF